MNYRLRIHNSYRKNKYKFLNLYIYDHILLIIVIIRRCIDHKKLAAYIYSFIFFWFCFVSLYIWLYVLYASAYNFVNYVFLLLCIIVYVFLLLFIYSYCYICSVLGILFHCAVLCIILYCDQQMHIYLTNYHTPTCFDTIVSSCSVYCLCVNVFCTTATRCQPNCS